MDFMDIRIARKYFLVIAAAFFLGDVTTELGAQGIQQVWTHKSGIQYEGILNSTSAVIEGTSVYSTYDSQQIVHIDEGLRHIFVSKNRAIGSIGDSTRNEIEIPILQNPAPVSEGHGSILRIGPFNQFGHRDLIIRTPTSPDPLFYVQGITKISPRYCEVKILVGAKIRPIQWAMKIATGTVPSDVLRGLLRSQIGNPDSASEYLKIAEFFLQAEQFDRAMEELSFIRKKFPDLTERINDDQILVNQARARQTIREVRLRLDAGQTQLASALANVFPKEGLAGETLAEFAEIDASVKQSLQRLDETRSQINTLINEVQNLDENQGAAVRRLRDELETDLNLVNVLRLDAYLRLASDDSMPAQQKLALAISGWLLGSNNAIENLGIAQDMFSVRDLIQKYLKTRKEDGLERSQILNQLAEFEAGTPNYLAPMIRQMNPLDAPDLSLYTGEKPIEFTIEVPGPTNNPGPQSFRCLVHLPTEYDPYRRYPLIISLPDGTQTVDQNLDLWCGGYVPALQTRVGHASRHGYVVLAVDWRLPGQGAYGYTGREHAVVLKAMRAALRKFSINADRVYLAGHGIGGDAAYDIGLSHPEHWAGIVSVSGKLDRYLKFYRKNKHLDLPIYSVVGSKDSLTIIANKDAWNDWLPSRQFMDCTVVMYDGRGNELFPEEIPETIKWMSAQRRRWPDKSGFSFECRSMRPWDCYFWFLEFDGIPADEVIWPEDWRDKNIPGLTFSGMLKSEIPNTFRIGPDSAKSVNPATLWLSPEYVNFDEEIHIKGLGNDFKDFVKPSAEVLLDDVRRRADREHPYWGRVDLRGINWMPGPPR